MINQRIKSCLKGSFVPTEDSVSTSKCMTEASLTLKVPIMTAAEDIHKYVFIVFQRK